MTRVKDSAITLEPLLSRMDFYGITRLADLTYLDNTSNIFVYSAIRPLAKSLTSSMGKGLTAEDAKCSAMMETIETWYAENVAPDICNRSFSDLLEMGLKALNPDTLFPNATISDGQSLDWCRGKLLIAEGDILIPHCGLSLDTNLVITKLVGQCSDGLASGNTLQEALLYSFFELNERISIRTGKPLPVQIDQKQLSSEISDDVKFNFLLYPDLFGMPVVGCFLQNKNPLDNNKLFAGFACRSNTDSAANAALMEAVQSKVGIISGVRDDITDDCYLYSGGHTRYPSPVDTIIMHTRSHPVNSVSSEYQNVLDLLKYNRRDLAFYQYTEGSISVVKSFLIAQ